MTWLEEAPGIKAALSSPTAEPASEIAAIVSDAWAAYGAGKLADAGRLWEMACSRFPEYAEPHAGLALCLRAMHEWDRAEAVIAAALPRFPANRQLLGDYAWIAQERGYWDGAAVRWAAYRTHFPEDPVGYFAAAIALRELRQYEEADAILVKGQRRQPDNMEIAENYAWNAHQRADWAEALRRWSDFTVRFPDHFLGYSSLGVVLRELERFEEADGVLREGLNRHPDNAELIGNYAWVAYNRHDWPEALKRWTDFRDRFPDQALGHSQVMLVLSELGRFNEVDSISRHTLVAVPADTNAAQLMLRFESLGDNCEFGVVQRHFGAEPLGLLRFTATPLELLVAALEARLAGVGEHENTVLATHNGEYLTTDVRYHMAMHTFIRASGDDHWKRLQNVCRRLRYLKDKLLADLAEARKSFVYSCNGQPADDDVRKLWQALRVYGDNRLLFVRVADEKNTVGSLLVLEKSLAIGHIDRLSVDAPAFDVWLRLCQQADRLWLGARHAFEQINLRG